MPPASKFVLFLFFILLIAGGVGAWIDRTESLTSAPATTADSATRVDHGIMDIQAPPDEPALVPSMRRGPANDVTIQTPHFRELITQQVHRSGQASPPLSSAQIETEQLELERHFDLGSKTRLTEATMDELLGRCRRGRAYSCRAWVKERAHRLAESPEFNQLAEEQANQLWIREIEETQSVSAYACTLGDADSCLQGLNDPSLQGDRGLRLLLDYCDSGDARYCREAGRAEQSSLWAFRSRQGSNANEASSLVGESSSTQAELEKQVAGLFARGCDLGDSSSCFLMVQSSSGPADEPRLQSALFHLERLCTPGREPISYLASCGALAEFYLRTGDRDLANHWRGLGCEYGRAEMCRPF